MHMHKQDVCFVQLRVVKISPIETILSNACKFARCLLGPCCTTLFVLCSSWARLTFCRGLFSVCSACSRETANLETGPAQVMDASWQALMHKQGLNTQVNGHVAWPQLDHLAASQLPWALSQGLQAWNQQVLSPQGQTPTNRTNPLYLLGILDAAKGMQQLATVTTPVDGTATVSKGRHGPRSADSGGLGAGGKRGHDSTGELGPTRKKAQVGGCVSRVLSVI